MHALSIKNLTKKYGDFTAVNDVSFDVGQGEIFGLLGPNGAGKTSIISVITTLEKPTSGQVEVFGNSVVSQSQKTKLNVGIVAQEIVNHGYFDVEEILTFYSGYYGRWENKDRIHFLLDRLALLEHRHKRVKQLSGGMKRRLMIAKALVHEPRLLLLDEPTAGVDIALRTSLWEFVEELRKEGVSVLLTTHYLEEAESLCDRVGIIHHGQVRRLGNTKELIRDLTQKNVTLELTSAYQGKSNAYLIENVGSTLRFQVPSDLSVGELLHQMEIPTQNIRDIQIQEGSLEDAFKTVLGSEA